MLYVEINQSHISQHNKLVLKRYNKVKPHSFTTASMRPVKMCLDKHCQGTVNLHFHGNDFRFYIIYFLDAPNTTSPAAPPLMQNSAAPPVKKGLFSEYVVAIKVILH